MNAKQSRIDVLLVERGLAPTRQRAQAMIMAGQVRIDNQLARKPSETVAASAQIDILGTDAKYASRAGLKLEGALDDFSVNARDCICLDVGSSNGGFTDCLLQHGARRVYAVDVNIAQLDWKLRRDTRVVAIKKNARFLKPADVPESSSIVTVDVSFISVTKILLALVPIAQPGAVFLILIKPQFELEKKLVGKGGIVRDAQLHERAINSVRAAAEKSGLAILSVQPSRVAGAEGNQEYFLHARRPDSIQFSALAESPGP
ncbi:MAG TPA: TlyA family RNA methyltransferase [Candidatus Acidoferrales bacterium]|nr:TlyA family RNA methyltransferase [Candidatus Acidoferrales bacterium]